MSAVHVDNSAAGRRPPAAGRAFRRTSGELRDSTARPTRGVLRGCGPTTRSAKRRSWRRPTSAASRCRGGGREARRAGGGVCAVHGCDVPDGDVSATVCPILLRAGWGPTGDNLGGRGVMAGRSGGDVRGLAGDVPTMYHAIGKQQGTAGNSGHLKPDRGVGTIWPLPGRASFWRRAHNPKVAGSNPAPATKKHQVRGPFRSAERASLLSACQRFVNTTCTNVGASTLVTYDHRGGPDGRRCSVKRRRGFGHLSWSRK